MSSSQARFFVILGLAFFQCLWIFTGCFIEVGNPGQPSQVSASFQVDYGPPALMKKGAKSLFSGVHITGLMVDFLEVEYGAEGQEHHLWKSDTSEGIPLDFANVLGPDSLPRLKIPDLISTPITVEFKLPAPVIPFNPVIGYLRGYMKAEDSVPFMFPLPTNQFNLLYGTAQIENWRQGNAYHLDVLFSVPDWLEGVDLTQAQSTQDSSGHPILLLDSLHNQNIYLRLKGNFLKAFNADSLYVGAD